MLVLGPAQGIVGRRQFSVDCPRMLVSINPGLLGGRAAGHCFVRVTQGQFLL
jgi:hypothetical protein